MPKNICDIKSTEATNKDLLATTNADSRLVGKGWNKLVGHNFIKVVCGKSKIMLSLIPEIIIYAGVVQLVEYPE